jgi:aryl-alcohol dehydrogenase-like predicted oxidoreductase
MKISRLAIGTAQFGLDYGINNTRGQVSEPEVVDILQLAYDQGVDMIDTAKAYGTIEDVLGRCMLSQKFNIVTKIPKSSLKEIVTHIQSSLRSLKIQKLYGCLFHDFASYKKDPSQYNILRQCQEDGLVKKIGFSLYHPHEFEDIIKNHISVDIVQVPYNVFDQRFNKYFNTMKDMNIEVHVRSVFLQGLFFKDPVMLDPFFAIVRPKIEKLQSIAAGSNLNVAGLCLSFALLNNSIDRVIVGIDDKEQLQELFGYCKNVNMFKAIYSQLSALHEDNEQIILPYLWKVKK